MSDCHVCGVERGGKHEAFCSFKGWPEEFPMSDDQLSRCASSVRDIASRIGVAANREWIKDQLERLANQWEIWAKISRPATESDDLAALRAECSSMHPHQPDIPPALDREGRCLVCVLIVERDAALARAEAASTLWECQECGFEMHAQHFDANSDEPCPVCAESRLRAKVEAAERELAIWKPMTPEEAEKALSEAEAVPLSDEDIARIVARATDPAERLPNNEQAQLAADNNRLRARVEALEAALRDQLTDCICYCDDSMAMIGRSQCKTCSGNALLAAKPNTPATGGERRE